MAISSYSIARALLKEKYALNAKTTQEALLDSRTCLRYFPSIPMGKVSECLDCLRTIASVKNTKASHTVLNPQVNKEELPGTWRHVQEYAEPPRAKTEPDVQDVYQLLKLGWLETLVGSDNKVDFSEARIREGRFLQDQPTGDDKSDDEKYLEVFWPSCSNAKLKTMVDQLGASTFTDPTIAGEKQAGIWRNNLVVPKAADDGSNVITMFLGIAHFRLDGFATWLTHRTENIAYLWGYSKDEAQAIGVAWKAKGRSARFQYNKSTGLVDIVLSERDYDPLTISSAVGGWDCRYKEIVDSYYGVEDPTLYPLTTTPADGVSYNRRVVDNGDGSWDIIVTTKNVQYRDAAFQNSQVSGDTTVTTRQQLGLTTQTAEPVVSTAGVIVSQRVDIKDDCSKDVITNKDAGYEQISTLTVASPSRTSTTVEKSVQSSPVSTASSEKGHIKRSVNKDSKYPSRYDTTEADEVPADQTETSADDSAAKSATRILHTENATALAAPFASAGTIKRNENTPVESGNTRTIEEVVTVKDQSASSADHSAAADSSKTIHTENSSVPTLSAGAGVVVRVEGAPTEAGKYRTTEETITVKDQAAVSTDISKASAATKTVHTEGDALSADSAAKGTIYRQESTPTEAGKYRTLRNVTVPTDQTAVSVDNSEAFVLTKTIHTENDTDLTTPEIVAGTITRQVATPTEAGNQRTTEDVYVPTNQTETGESHSSASDSTEEINTELAKVDYDALDKDAEDFTIRNIRATPTEAGNVRVQDSVITPVNQTETGESHSHAADSTQKIDTEMTAVDYDALDKTAEAASGDAAPAWDEEETYALEAVVRSGTSYWASLKASNLNNEPTVGDTWWVKTVPPSAGSIRDVSAAPTEAGNVRVQDRTTTPVNQTEKGESHSAAADSTEEINTELAKVDYDALDKTAAVGTIRDVRATPTEAGNVRTQDRVKTPIDQIGTGGEDSLARSVETIVHTENEAEPTVGTATAGTVKKLSSTPTEAGKFRTAVDTITPKQRTITEGRAGAFATSVNTIKTQETTAEAVPSAVAGQVITVRNQPTDTGFQTEKNVATAVAKDSGAVVSYTDDAIITTQKYHNATAIVDATDSTGHNITVEGDINDSEKYDYIKKDVQARTPRSFGGSAVTYDTLGGWYGIGVWRIRYHHTINYHTTATAAATALADGWIGSGISSAGNNLWQSHKMIRDDIYTG